MYHKKSLLELHNQYNGLRLKGIPDVEREIGLLEAQVQGLLDYRPEGFGAKVEALRTTLEKRQWALENARQSIAVMKEVIDEKEAEL
jgi:hypothetical protein